MLGRLENPIYSNSCSVKNYKPVCVTCWQKFIETDSRLFNFARAYKVASVTAWSRWSPLNFLSFFESFRKDSKELSSMSLHNEISIAIKCLQDFPNSMITELLIGTDLKFKDLIFGARYPILLIKSLEISVL